MREQWAALLWIASMFVAQCAWSQDKNADMTDMQELKNSVAKDRKALVAATLDLKAAEAKKFWPLYDAYQRSVDAANRRRTAAFEGLIALNKPMSDLYARNLANELTATDEAEIKARRALHNRILRALPAKKAVRYLQLESKIRAVQAYDIATAFPLVK
jgi:Spy/CpxP family protein refolding chaperone